jgi:predicted negative regulator of RcsB-dependent stress response
VGTTKLTRKEILAEDPVHAALIRIIEVFRSRGRIIVIAAVSIALLAVGIYFGLRYLETVDLKAQELLGRGVDYFHGSVDADALDDPYGKGPTPLFRSEEAKYKAAAEVFSGFVSAHRSSRLTVVARYYLALCQMNLGQKDEAVRNLEEVRNNTKDRTVGYLAKKVLAGLYLESGKSKESVNLLEGMIKDPQCELPKEMLRIDLSRAYLAAGNREEAQKVLKMAREESQPSILNSMAIREMERLEKSATIASPAPKPESARP